MDDLEHEHGLATARRCAQLTRRPSEKAFVMWARRNGITPVRVVRLGRTQIALYSLNDIWLDTPVEAAAHTP